MASYSAAHGHQSTRAAGNLRGLRVFEAVFLVKSYVGTDERDTPPAFFRLEIGGVQKAPPDYSKGKAWESITVGEKLLQSTLAFLQSVYRHQSQLIVVKLQQCCNVMRVGVAHLPRLGICCPG